MMPSVVRLLLFVVLVVSIEAQAIREYPLNSRAVVELDVSDEVTTIVFPEPITAIAGAGMLIDDGRAATDVEEKAILRFQVSHAPASNFILVRSLQAEAGARLTAIYKNEAYVFQLQSVPTGSIASAILRDVPAPSARPVELPPAAVKFSPKIGFSLLDRARAYPLLVDALPRAVEGVSLHAQDRVIEIAGLRIHVQEVYRFAREDALVFLVRLTNTSGGVLNLAPETFAVRVGDERYEQSIASGPEELTPGESADAEFAIVGTPDGLRNDLSADNAFTVLLQFGPRPSAVETPVTGKAEDEAGA